MASADTTKVKAGEAGAMGNGAAAATGGASGGELPKQYRPAEYEGRIRAKWEGSGDSGRGAFHADPSRVLSGERKAYGMVIPPPNVTAALHLGHALNNTIQDILARAHRMMGYETLWMPGTDHAGIATQAVVERRVWKEEGKRRTDFSREEFVAKIQAFKDEYEATITEQLKAMGCSCDWPRQRFTMDEQGSRAVREAFFRLFRDGLIYRGKRLVNWDPVLQTAVADDETYDEEVDSQFYYMRYPLVRVGSGGAGSGRVAEWQSGGVGGGADAASSHSATLPLRHFATTPVTWDELARRGYPGAEQHPADAQAWVTVATTRPETYLGDAAVGVNPHDPRLKALDGLWVELPIVGRVLPIVADEYVVLPKAMARSEEEANDPKAEYATGFLKVTPAHDQNDYDLYQRRKAEIDKNSAGTGLVNVMAPDASISDKHGWSDVGDAGLFVGLSREAARKKVVEEFRARGLLEGTRPYRQGLKFSDRSKAVIEPYLSDQWYVRVTDERLAGAANRALVPEQRTGVASEVAPLSRAVSPVEPVSRPAAQDGPGTARESRSTDTALESGATESGATLTGADIAVLDGNFIQARIPGFVACDPYPPGRPKAEGLIEYARNLPHLEMPRATYFVTWRTQGDLGLTAEERTIALDALRHWDGTAIQLYAATVMSTHVHALVRLTGEQSLGEWVASVKKFSSRRINAGRGRSGHAWEDERFDHIVRDEWWFAEFLRYIARNPVEAGLVGRPSAYAWTVVHRDVVAAIGRGADPRGAVGPDGGAGLPTGGSGRAGNGSGEPFHQHRSGERCHLSECDLSECDLATSDGSMRFYPARYAKTFENWHDNIRDWCISRQLWWGHRIPVWSKIVDFNDPESGHRLFQLSERMGRGAVGDDGTTNSILFLDAESGERLLHWDAMIHGAWRGRSAVYVCLLDDTDAAVWEADGFVRDSDVLDTWFSSALWPMSTMGWPDDTDLLKAFNPTSSLSTAREIITLWVSRMVMFNRYFMPEGWPNLSLPEGGGGGVGSGASRPAGGELTQNSDYGAGEESGPHGAVANPPPSPLPLGGGGGPVPFRDVFIHAMIQDGEGRKMSKSLGNGVDPLDIIDTHGADAMRFTLCHMTTQTQDVRMPVVKDAATGKNTSPKFDLGRNFANKLWNAARFAMGMLGGVGGVGGEKWQSGEVAQWQSEGAAAAGASAVPSGHSAALSLVDRWMLSRLVAGVAEVEAALKEYQFSAYAQTVYDLLWRDFCDWYLEAIKPTAAADASQRAVLRASLDAIVRLLHPVMPFITEAIHERLREVPVAPVEGVELDASGGAPDTGPGGRERGGARPTQIPELLAVSRWPVVSASLRDEEAERRFERVRGLVTAIREVRAQHQVHDRRKIVVHAPAELLSALGEDRGLVETLARLERLTADRPEGGAPSVAFRFEGAELLASDLAEAVDPSAERERLGRIIADAEKKISIIDARLNNPGYVAKAPAKLVEESRAQRAKAAEELEAARGAMERLG